MIARNQARGVKQLLKDLVVRREVYLAANSQLLHPEHERRLHRLGGES